MAAKKRTPTAATPPAEPPPLRTSHGGKAIRWMEKHLIHGEGDLDGQPYRVLPWHREFAWRWYELDPTNALRSPWWYQEALVGAERGAVKTEWLAALAHVEMSGPLELRGRAGTPLVHCAAAALKQAGEMFRQVQIMGGGAKGEERPRAPLFGVYEILDTVVSFADGRPGRIERIAAEAGTNEGGKTTLFLADEVAEWTGRRARVFDVINAATTKRTPPGRTIGISMAGHRRGSLPAEDDDDLLWRLYARGLLEAGDPESRYLFSWAPELEVNWADPESVMAALRRQKGADVTWVAAVRLREIMSRKISQHEALRLYLCGWPKKATDTWLKGYPNAWSECAGARPDDGTDVVVGVDMGLHSDSVGVIVAGFDSQGRVCWAPYHWTPHPLTGRIDHADVFATIAGTIAQRWKVSRVTYDPRFFEVPARLLEDQGIATVEFPQTPERLVPCDDLLLRMVVGHEVQHPNDPVLNAHVEAGAWREGERGRYLSKGKALAHMDLLRAGAMATWELVAGEADAGSVYDTRDLRTL